LPQLQGAVIGDRGELGIVHRVELHAVDVLEVSGLHLSYCFDFVWLSNVNFKHNDLVISTRCSYTKSVLVF